MGIIEKIRSKPHEEKIKIMWGIIILTALLLIALWIISAKFNNRTNKDTTLFQTIGQGIKDIKDNYKRK